MARLRRSLIVSGLYIFFAALMMVFWLVLGAAGSQWLSASFFVFASVFNLFVASLFWILMSDIYESGQAKRLYGFIAAGGTTGAVLDPLVANWLAPMLGGWNLILVAATVLLSAAALSFWLRDAAVGGANGENIDAPPGFRTVMSGAESVIRYPYLLRIAFYVLMANFLSTFFYLDQVRLAGETIHEATARVQFFAQRDLITSVFTVLVQMLLTGRITARLGLGVAASALPAVTIAGLILYAAVPELQVVAAIMVVERVTAFALSNPALKVLYTAIDAMSATRRRALSIPSSIVGVTHSRGLYSTAWRSRWGLSSWYRFQLRRCGSQLRRGLPVSWRHVSL